MSVKFVKTPFKALLAAAFLLSASHTALAESVEQRLSRLENLLSNQVLPEQSQRMEQIQQERQFSATAQASIKQRQRNLYQDMDRRLHDLEIKGGGSSSSSSRNTAPAVSPGGASPVPPPGGSAKPAAPTPVAVVSSDKNGKSAYTQAFNILKQGKYQEAIQAFNDFQQEHPDSIYGANAQYWLGEAYSALRDYKTALSAFQKVIAQYPQSNKVEGSMLKIGYTYYEMQDWASAKSALETVISKYPGSTVSRKAQERLQRIQREGH